MDSLIEEIRKGIAYEKRRIAGSKKEIEIATASIALWQAKCDHAEADAGRKQFCPTCSKMMFSSTD